ncbi:MAG: efflux RND transporter periplasmic adaptor subunit [Bacteroidales bacterium]
MKQDCFYKPSGKLRKTLYLSSFFLLALTLLMQSCNNGSSSSEDDSDQIRNRIDEYNDEINRLTQEVDKLHQTLNARGVETGGNDEVAVTVSKLEPSVFADYFSVSATVEAVNSATISPETSGHIRRLYAEKGEPVKRGQVIARLSTDVAEGQIEETETSLQFAETVYQRQKRLWDKDIGSEIEYLEAKNQAERLRKNLETLRLQKEMAVMKAPFDGFVDEHFIEEGELAMPGTPVMEIINLDELYINADVSESYLPYVFKGRDVILRFPAYPDVEMTVPVHRVGHVINPESRSFRLQLKIRNDNDRFKPNMMANVSVQVAEVEDAIVIPSMLIGYDTQGNYVYVADEDSAGNTVASKVYIERGENAEGATQVTGGLEAGDLLIMRGHRNVTDGEKIRIESNQ